MARPKKNKSGYVFYDKSRDRWKVEYFVIDKESKTEKKLSKTFMDEKEAKEFLNTIQYRKEDKIFIQNNGIPLNELMKAITERKFDRDLISDGQFARIGNTIKVIEKSPISHKNIEDISSDDIQDYLNTLKDYSNSYIKKIYEQFSQAFTYAMNKGYISRTPMVEVTKPKSNKADKIVRALEVEEQQIFTNYLTSKTIEEEPYKNIYLIQMYMGLRVGEATALRSSDINLQKNIMSVNKTVTADRNGKAIMGERTKTYAGMRDLPIPKVIRDSIIEQMQIAENNQDKQLFLSTNGNYIDSRNVNRALKKLLADLGITGISTHSLRHTYGTRCIEAGMRDVALQRLMGHTDISITKNVYMTVFNSFKEKEIDKVNDFYLKNHLFESELNLLEDMNEQDKGEMGEREFE